jgi:spoIIIJ-associated protein
MSERKYTIATHEDAICDFLEPVLDLADLDVEFDFEEPDGSAYPEIENPDLIVQFTGEDVAMLLRNKAELLLALEHLTQEALGVPHEDHSRLCFDANDYRLMRLEEIRMTAVAAAEKVKSTGKAFFFGPMTSRERRIVHISLRNETEVRSESVGVGPARVAVIVPKDMPTPEPPPPPKRVPFESTRDRGRGRDGRGGGGGGRGRDGRGSGGGRGRDDRRGPRR